ncbi:Spx/MgsR family transcriptional regulator [Litorivivens lipolytica]|uniref:Spx/MgsR family transcriptional regulator n=1 Tax=Litorivivens lipolytica TaxID=1524264 RepID=A0A7W4Z4C5_9GAMM|nr:arsenate reductase [Litorivivens lipolytica]MBB3045917.1 Spx/MgsR family transcriptional regulator [Litorivivens lipolytica]
MIKLYGIKNCDTVRKARKWLEQKGIEHTFTDYRDEPLSKSELNGWYDAVGDKLLNKRSTTWKQLSDAERSADSKDAIVGLLAQHPTLIKRPVLVKADTVHVGFSDKDYQQFF